MMKNLIKKIGDLAGFEIYKKENLKISQFATGSRGLFVTLTGLSGVGKSTLYDYLVRRKRGWMTPGEFKKLSSAKLEYDFMKAQEVYEKLSEFKFEDIYQSNYSAADKFKSAYWNYQALQADVLIRKFNTRYAVFSDEGILHTFQHAIFKLEKEAPQLLKEFLQNSALIYCYADQELLVDRILKRGRETGRVVAFHKDKDVEALKQDIQKRIERQEDYLALMEKYGVPVLRICTEDTPALNAEKINQFIEGLISKNQKQ